ncbi:MAG TPA: class I SAM-dependent methyltransferase [Dongiaceae bacterium]|nr:class I SAM-dependent methyltransferase [Dongiaceae bacterium]
MRKLWKRLKKRIRRLFEADTPEAQYARRIRKQLNGVHPRICNICGYEGLFKAHGFPPRYDARCPNCKSLERQRHQALWIADNAAELRGRRILHFSPEVLLSKLYRGMASTYASANIVPGLADLTLNIERIDQPDASWDVVVANHVLEHVDDRKALAEIRRVLAPGGLAILSFPIAAGFAQTYENPAITSKAGRALHFGQWDHIRYYGADAADRIAAAGFNVTVFGASEPFVHRHGIGHGARLFLARKS